MIQNNFTIVEGSVPVLVSAPHTYNHLRPSMKGSLKQAEEYLELMVKEICEKSGAWGIFLNEESAEYDPNYHKLERNPYKREIKSLLQEKKISYVIDLHGLSNKHEFDIAVYYCIRYRRSKDMALGLIKEFSKIYELKDLSYKINYMAKNLQETITEYACEVEKFPAIQIEISKYLRKDLKLRESIVSSIVNYIKTL